MPDISGVFNNLPPEYQQQIDDLQRRQALAQAMAQRSMNFQGATNPGPMASRTPLAAVLAQLASGALNSANASQAQSGIRDVQKQAQTDQMDELARLQKLAPDERLRQLQTSKFPILQSLGKTLADQQAKNLETGAKIVGDYGDPGGAISMLRGGALPSDYAPNALPDPVFGKTPEGNPYALMQNRRGEKKIEFPPAVGTVINLPGDEGKMALQREQEDLATRQGKAQAGQATLGNMTMLTKALQAGGQVGGGGDYKQNVRKFFQAFGVDSPVTGATEETRRLLQEQIAARAKTFGSNPSNIEDKMVNRLIGDLDSDPNALSALIAHISASAIKPMQDFSTFIAEKRKGTASTKYPELYNTADVGLNPPQLQGPVDLQLATLSRLKDMGGDITKFYQPNVQDAQGNPIPYDANTEFNVQPKSLVKPAGVTGLNGASRAPAPSPDRVIDLSTMSPEQQAAIKKALGL